MATTTIYDSFYSSQWTSPIDFDTDTIRLAMVSNAYTPNAATHNFFDDVSANSLQTELMSNFTVTAGGLSANNVTYAQNAAGWSTGRYLVMYQDTGSAATSPLVLFVTYSADQSQLDGPVNVNWAANVSTAGLIATLQAA